MIIDPPKYLYRGMCIGYDDLKDFAFYGTDMELTYDPYIDSQGKETVHDGNEYGIYMSDNPKVATYAYGNATNSEKVTYIEPRIAIGNRGTEFISIPAIGVCYRISTQGLNIRKPWINPVLQGLYNNGFEGDEWIADRIPAENYELMSVQIGKDLLHDEQYVDLSDIRSIKERTTQILEQRKARLEVFAQEMSKIPEEQRAKFDLSHLKIFKEIYGENGFYYMENIDGIDTSSNIGMIRYLMANVYKDSADSIDFDTLLYLQGIKEKVEVIEKKGKEIDLRDYFSNDQKMLEMMEQKEKGQINSNSEPGTEVVVDYYEKYGIGRNEDYKSIKEKLGKELAMWSSRAGSTSRDAVEVLAEIESIVNELLDAISIFNPKYKERRAEYDAKLEQQKKRAMVKGEPGTEVVVDYYEKYGIGRNEDSTLIRKKLGKEQRKWMNRQSSTNDEETLAEIKSISDEISNAISIFNPKYKERRAEYDAKLEQQKKREEVNGDSVKVDGSAREGINKIALRGISTSLRANPLSLAYLKGVQREMASQVKVRESGDSLQPLSANSTEISDSDREE